MKHSDDVIFFHEDSYRQIELISAENYRLISNTIDSFPNQKGGKNGYAVGVNRQTFLEKGVELSSRKIHLIELKELLDPLSLNFFTHITTGYTSYVESASNIVVWGFEFYGLFIEYDDNSIVHSIWINHSSFFLRDESGKLLFNAIHTLGHKYSLVLCDWNQEIIVSLETPGELFKYFSEVLYLNPF